LQLLWLKRTRLLPWAIALTIAICLLPFALNQLGFDFGAYGLALESAAIDKLHRHLSSSFWPTALEWSACCAALFTFVLALAYFTDFRLPSFLQSIVEMCSIRDAWQAIAFHDQVPDDLPEAVVGDAKRLRQVLIT